jgi:hypothetical protein
LTLPKAIQAASPFWSNFTSVCQSFSNDCREQIWPNWASHSYISMPSELWWLNLVYLVERCSMLSTLHNSPVALDASQDTTYDQL